MQPTPRRRFLSCQRPQFSYAMDVQHPALFVEMRLGKTLPTIRRSQMYVPLEGGRLRVLVVAPSSALGSWENQLSTEGRIDWVYLIGTKKQRLTLLAEDHGWNLLNKEGHLALPEIADVPWDCVVLDESTFIKNPKAKVTKFFLQNFRKVPHRWALTGLPNPESDLEFWTQIAWLDGRAFGCKSFWQFRARHFEQHWMKSGWQPKAGTQSFIRKEVGKRACVLRRKDVGIDLPKVYETREFDLPKKLRKAYDQAEEEFILSYEGKEQSTLSALAKNTWLWRMCGGIVDEELVWEDKIREVVYFAKQELAREQIVVWFVFNLELKAVYKAVKAEGISCQFMRGSTPIRKRHKIVADFQEGKIRVLLLQEKIAQTGMDLSASDTNIIYSSPPGLWARRQIEDRTLNPLKPKSVLFIDLAVKDSVDMDLRKAILEKDARSDLTLGRAMILGMKERQKKRKSG